MKDLGFVATMHVREFKDWVEDAETNELKAAIPVLIETGDNYRISIIQNELGPEAVELDVTEQEEPKALLSVAYDKAKASKSTKVGFLFIILALIQISIEFYFYFNNPAEGRANNALLMLRALTGFMVLFLIGFNFLYSASYKKRLPALEIFEKTIHFHVKHTFGRLIFPDIRTVVLSIENKADLRLMSDTIKVFQRSAGGSQYDTKIKKKDLKIDDLSRLQEFVKSN